MNNSEEKAMISNKERPKKWSRRRFLKIGFVSIFAISGGLSLTPKGRLIKNRIEEEIYHSTDNVRKIPKPSDWSDKEITIAWLGHASFLLNFYGTRILIDPALENRIGITPIGDYTIGPKRYITEALKPEEVGPVDLLLVSHAHTDHFDYPTLRKLQSPNTAVITAKNTLPLWEGMKFKSIDEIHWQESKTISDVTIKAIEGKHWGARLPWIKGMEANSLLITKNGVNIFFGGDTGYTEKIKQQLMGIPIKVAMMGIAAYLPKSFEDKHCTPEQGWQMAEEMGAEWVIPMHWGTFRLSQEPMDEPMARFKKVAGENIDRVPIQEVGAAWVVPEGIKMKEGLGK